MKKQFFRYLSGIIPAIALFAHVNAHAQVEKPGMESNPTEFNEPSVNHASTNQGNTVNITTRVLKDFNKIFKGADKVDWSGIKHGFLAKFENNGVKTRAYYDMKGRLSATITTYGEDKLPKEIRKQVRSTYYDYSIYLVNEVTVGDKTAYLVSIQDEETIKTIRVMDDEMDVYEDFKKAR